MIVMMNIKKQRPYLFGVRALCISVLIGGSGVEISRVDQACEISIDIIADKAASEHIAVLLQKIGQAGVDVVSAFLGKDESAFKVEFSAGENVENIETGIADILTAHAGVDDAPCCLVLCDYSACPCVWLQSSSEA